MASETPDKNYLYGEFQKHQQQRDKLGLRMAHKALDIPEDDMNIMANTTTNKTGLGALGAVGVALASAAVPSALAAYLAFKEPAHSPAPPGVNNTSGFLIELVQPKK